MQTVEQGFGNLPFEIDELRVQREFLAKEKIFRVLADEVKFIVENKVSEHGIKLHGIEFRIKQI
jgi:hypothetical protein